MRTLPPDRVTISAISAGQPPSHAIMNIPSNPASSARGRCYADATPECQSNTEQNLARAAPGNDRTPVRIAPPPIWRSPRHPLSRCRNLDGGE